MSVRLRVTVAGAGMFGLSSALALLVQGAEVLVLDPGPVEASASAVAAGLLAPVGEAVFDPDAAAHYPLMAEALALWPAFAADRSVSLSHDGLILPKGAATVLATLGLAAEAHPLGLFVQADPRVVEPTAALRTLRRQVEALGGTIEARPVAAKDWRGADRVVLATGAGAEVARTAPELAHLTPVKGQIAVLPRGPATGPTLRWAGGYLAPQPGGARVGATMEPGRRDLSIDPDAVEGLLAAAAHHVDGLDLGGAYGQAGVRMQSPDALPLVGPSALERTLVAAGARRNGWLFGPLVGRMIAAYCKGEDPGPWASLLHPGRFDRG